MAEQSIVLSFRFSGELNQKEAIVFFSTQFEKWFGKSINELNYTITDKSKSSWKQKTKSLKYTDSNLLKFSELLSERKEKVYIDFELLRNLPNIEYKSRDIDFSILYNRSETISSLNVVFNTSMYSNTDWKGFVKLVIKFLIEQHCEICYAFVLNLDNIKNPALYVEGIGNGSLAKNEEEKLALWSNNMNRCNEKIWDIFWGNIISTKYILQSQTLEDIEKLVGKENVVLLTPTLIWFNLKERLTDFNITRYSQQRTQLYNYFSSRHLLFTV